MSFDLQPGSTDCPKCGADLSGTHAVEMRPCDSGHFELDSGGFHFVFDDPMSFTYLDDPSWVPDAACAACGAEIYGDYAID